MKLELKEFRKYYSKHSNQSPIDLRSDVFLENKYGATPMMTYNRAEDIMKNLYAYLDSIEYNRKANFKMDLEMLRNTALKTFLETL